MFAVLGKKWNGEEYILGYNPKSESNIFDIGLNHKVGSKWPDKEWPDYMWHELSTRYSVFDVTWQRGEDSLHEYIDWINSCKVLISSDSLGVHIAFALKKKVVVLFGPTNPNEVYLYGRGVALYDSTLDCRPCQGTCYKRISHHAPCVLNISVDRVVEVVKDAGGIRSANADMSSVKGGGIS